jgi:hypothetical protein
MTKREILDAHNRAVTEMRRKPAFNTRLSVDSRFQVRDFGRMVKRGVSLGGALFALWALFQVIGMVL